MVIKTASPGIIVNEVDLTRGTSDAITTNVGGFCGPFEKGPVDELVLIDTEAEFQRVFGDPTDYNYEYWWTVSNFLDYGGVCYVVRCDDSVGDAGGTGLQAMRNSCDVKDGNGKAPYIKNKTDFEENFYLAPGTPAHFIGRNPGTWGNGLSVAVIDAGADYLNGLKTTGQIVNATGAAAATTVRFDTATAAGATVGTYTKVAAVADPAYSVGDYLQASQDATISGIVMAVDNGVYQIASTGGTAWTSVVVGTTTLTDLTTVSSAVTAVENQGSYKLYDPVVASNNNIINTIFTPNTYTKAEGVAFATPWPALPSANQQAKSALGDTYYYDSTTGLWTIDYIPVENNLLTDGTNSFQISVSDSWYNNQIAFQGIPWYRFAGRPGTTMNAVDKGATNDELHLIVYDATGDTTGSKGNTIAEYIGVSKLRGALTPEGERNYYSDRINNFSNWIYSNHDVDWPAMTTGTDPVVQSGINTGLSAAGSVIGDGVNCAYVEAKSYNLLYGVDNYTATLGELQSAYNKFSTENVSTLDYIMQGPSMGNVSDAVAKANFIISIVEERKDCMAFLSPPRYAIIGQSSSDKQADNVVEWAEDLSSSSYTVFDSGYKYQYDRFNDVYRYVPLNGDIAGTLVYTSLASEPFYSPAGISRGQIRNVVKLPFNPAKKQRDALYSARVNPVVSFPGEGTVLFGDKTALGYSSAFDRINVRRLFLIIEKEVAKISRVNLFEFNDEVTRSLFKNNVNPFLRDIQSKRGMYDFLVVCDATNNPPEIIDRNEFVGDIYIKPAKSINFITLNFIATKTGVTFDESIGLFRGGTATTRA